MTTLSVTESLLYGWRTFKTRPRSFVQVSLILFAVSLAFNVLGSALGAAAKEATGSAALIIMLVSLIVSLASIYVNVTVSNMGVLTYFLNAHDDATRASLRDLWRPHPFRRYVLAMLIVLVLVVGGLVLLIVPGIIIGLALSFTTYIVLTRDLSAVEAVRESARITKGNRYKLLLLSLAVMLLNMAGFAVFLVGLFVTIPVSMLAYAHAFRTLENAGNALVPEPAA